jgi:hypothetical protein
MNASITPESRLGEIYKIRNFQKSKGQKSEIQILFFDDHLRKIVFFFLNLTIIKKVICIIKKTKNMNKVFFYS